MELKEDGPDLTLDIPDWTYPDVAEKTAEQLVDAWAEIVGSVKYGDTTKELSRSDISKEGRFDDGALKLWFENADRPNSSTSVFLTRELTIDDFCYDGGKRFKITPFGSVDAVGDKFVYLPDHVTVK